MAFNDKLKELRNELKLTQKELAQKLGLSTASIVAYERDEKKPSFDVLLRIATEFDVSLDWLCTEKESAKLSTKKWSDVLHIVYSLLECEKLPIKTIQYKKEDIEMAGIEFSKNLIDQKARFADIDEVSADGYAICREEHDCHDMTDYDLYGFENPIYNFIVTYQKMKELLKSGNIKQELFDLWLDDEFKKNNRLI
ncbi:MAG: helix-turn-helix domain-containing protein [Acutalibacteraceae bacterium]